MAGNDQSFGGGWRYGWQPGITRKPDWLTMLAYSNPELATDIERCPALMEAITAELRELGLIKE